MVLVLREVVTKCWKAGCKNISEAREDIMPTQEKFEGHRANTAQNKDQEAW
jgi:hypothetical protein